MLVLCNRWNKYLTKKNGTEQSKYEKSSTLQNADDINLSLRPN